MMAEGGSESAASRTSFSEISELPPLKEVYDRSATAACSPCRARAKSAATPTTMYTGTGRLRRKPKVQPREVAQKAIKEIKGVPPKLMLYSLGGAVALILLIGIGVTIYIHGLGSDDDAGARRAPRLRLQKLPRSLSPRQHRRKRNAPAPVARASPRRA